MTEQANAGTHAGASQGVPSQEALDETHQSLGNPLPPIDNGPAPKDLKADDAAVGQQVQQEQATAGAETPREGPPEPPVGEWATFEEPAAQAAVELLKQSGVTIPQADAIFAKALESGDIADVDTKLLTELIGPHQATLVLEGVKAYHQAETARVMAEVKIIHDIYGGEKGWETVRDWARIREQRDPAFKSELDGIRADIARGGRAARAAAQDLLQLYNGNPQTKGLGNEKLVRGQAAAKESLAPLSRADYLTELKKLHANGDPKPELLQQLDARRLAGKKHGI